MAPVAPVEDRSHRGLLPRLRTRAECSIRAVGVLVGVVAVVLRPACVWPASLSDILPRFVRGPAGSRNTGSVSDALVGALSTSVARATPVLGASAGFVYHFDWETGTFEREPSLFGQFYIEGADPIGRRRLNLSVSYQRVQIDTLQGKDIRNLTDTQAPIPAQGLPGGLTIPRFGMALDTQQVTVGATYGVTDDLEVNVALLVLQSDFEVDTSFGLRTSGARGARGCPCGVLFPPSKAQASAIGVGDVLLRGKYRLLAQPWLHLAAGLIVRTPTGNDDDFQGTGAVEVAPMLYASREPFAVAQNLRFRPYINAGFNFDANDVDGSEGRWGVGLDGVLGERFTLGIAALGRHPVNRLGPLQLFDITRVDLRTGRQFSAPLFGLSSGREDFYDFTVGGRVNVWRDRANLFANAVFPLNRAGARADVIPLAGGEVTF